MPAALGFRSAGGWSRLFTDRDLDVRATRWLGSRLERLIHHPVLFVLDVGASRRRDPRAPYGSAAVSNTYGSQVCGQASATT